MAGDARSALSIDDDGILSPVRAFRYRLTASDFLAYEQLPAELTGWKKFLAILSVAAIGGLMGLFSDDVGGYWALGIGVLLAALWILVLTIAVNLLRIRRARHKARAGSEMVFEDFGDHLAIRRGQASEFLAIETIGKVISGDSHVFILYEGGPIIVPLRAFEDASDMSAFAAVLDQRSQDAAG